MIQLSGASNAFLGISKEGPRCTIHLLGPGNVGCAFLELVDQTSHIITGVTDSSGTVINAKGLDCDLVISTKRNGNSLASIGESEHLSLGDAVRKVDADVVIDTTATGVGRKNWGETLNEVVVQSGKPLILAAKDVAASYADRWSNSEPEVSVGINAVLGGTGLQLFESKNELKKDWIDAAFAGSATTTTIIEVLEDGGSLEDGLVVAGERGFLEADPELDLKGVDAGLKLSVVEAFLRGKPAKLIDAQDIRDVDPDIIRGRTREGLTTRLVGRIHRNGSSTLNYEPVPKGGPLDIRCDEVVYTYQLANGKSYVYNGQGVGAKPTAEAVLADLNNLSNYGNCKG